MSEPWWTRRMVAFDVETTGTSLEESRIVAAAVVFCGGGEPTESHLWLADPGVEIPEGATAVHGITTEHAKAFGRPAAEVIAEMLAAIESRPGGAPVVAMNARFDCTILDREARRYGLTPLGVNRPLLVVDPLVVDKHLDRYRRGSRKLDAMCAHYGAALDQAHDASSDALAVARLAWAIAAKGRAVRRRGDIELEEIRVEWERVRGDLPALHDAEQRWARVQAEGLQRHFASQGRPERVEAAWPVVPAPVPAGVA